MGFEGFAICASDRIHLLGGYGSPIEVLRGSDDSDELERTEEPGKICFNFLNSRSATSDDIRPVFSVTLPLANTVFQTGQRSLLHLSKWTQNARGFHLLEKKEGTHVAQILNLPAEGSHGFNSPARSGNREDGISSFTMFTSLMPLTPLRQVVESTGNVVSKITGMGEKTSMTASQELEPAVSQISSRSQYTSIEKAAIWALVIPTLVASRFRDKFRISNISEKVVKATKRRTSKISNDSSVIPLNLLICEGASLHRVLSGGGGWGQKAGLISLDPETTFEGNASSWALNLDADVSGNGESFFTSVAKPGDLIGFYAGPNPSNHLYIGRQPVQEQSPKEFVRKTGKESRKSSIEFGTIPQLDDLPQRPSDSAMGSESTAVIKNHFGALSEGGMALSYLETESQNLVKTRMDAPFSKLGFEVIVSPRQKAKRSAKWASSIDWQSRASLDDAFNRLNDSINHGDSLKDPSNKWPLEGFRIKREGKETLIKREGEGPRVKTERKGFRIKREVGRKAEMIRKHDANSSVYGASLKHEQRMATIEYQKLMQARKSVPWRAKYNEPREPYHGGGSTPAE